MTDLVNRGEALLEGVTEGPWKSCHVGNIHYGVSHGDYTFPTVVEAQCQYDGFGNGSQKADAEFIAASRQLVPELLAEVKSLRAALLDEHDSHVETVEIMRRAADQRDQWKTLWEENLLQASTAMGERDRANELLDEIAEIADSYRLIDAEQILEVLRPFKDEDQ